MECEKLETLDDYVKKYPEGFEVPEHLRPDGFPPKTGTCRRCPKGYIIPEPTKEEIKIKKQEEDIKKLLDHVARLTEQVNQITLKMI